MANFQYAIDSLLKSAPGGRRTCAVRAKAIRSAKSALMPPRHDTKAKHCMPSRRRYRDVVGKLGEYTQWMEFEYEPCFAKYELNVLVDFAEEAYERDCGGGLAGRRTKRKVRR